MRFLCWMGLTLFLSASIAASNAAESATSSPADQRAGKQVYAANCAVCHGANGGGGFGPSLQQIAARRSFDQTVGFIENPLGPMPKLYPEKLSEAQVRDVAAYIRGTFQQPANARAYGAPGMMGRGMMGQGMMGPGMMYGYGPGGYGPGMMFGPGMMYGPGRNRRGYQNASTTLNLSVNDVKRYFVQWLTAQGNPHVKLGIVKAKDANTITAEIVTKDKNSLVERYEVNRHTGYIRPVH